ncbi:MAG: MFS transporter, partial [Dehalococcoidia bacterium]
MNRRLLEDPSHPTSLSHHPDFIKLWVGQTISIAGMKVTGLAVPLTAVLALHATPIQMSLMNVAWNSSAVLTGLFAGVLVDRLPRRPVLIGMDLGRMALVASI